MAFGLVLNKGQASGLTLVVTISRIWNDLTEVNFCEQTTMNDSIIIVSIIQRPINVIVNWIGYKLLLLLDTC